MYSCADGHSCLIIQLVCDGIGHCPDIDDELNCGFESKILYILFVSSLFQITFNQLDILDVGMNCITFILKTFVMDMSIVYLLVMKFFVTLLLRVHQCVDVILFSTFIVHLQLISFIFNSISFATLSSNNFGSVTCL